MTNTQFSFDVGTLLSVHAKLRLGLVGKYLGKPEFETADGAKISVEPRWRSGFAYFASPNFMLSGDIDLSTTTLGPNRVTTRNGALGMQLNLAEGTVALRAGVRDSLEGLSSTECRVRIIHGAIGNANESDILLASASDAVTLLFQSEVEPRAAELAEREGVEVRKYSVIYDLIEDVKAALEGLLAPEIVDVVVGKGEVKALFKVKTGVIAGSAVRDGKIARGGLIRVVRDGKIMHTGKVSTLRHFKDDVKEVEKGQECGIGIDGFNDVAVGDLLEFFVKESRTRRLSQSPR